MPSSLSSQIAGFSFDHESRLYVVTVCGYVVAELATLAQVQAFSVMHNNRIAETI